MLISLTLENWASFREKTEFSMVAGEEGRHAERVPVLAGYGTRVLPAAAIFGGNATGKTNLCEALGFAKELVTEGDQTGAAIAVRPFSLHTDTMYKPSRFCFRLSADGTVYEFSFTVSWEKVLKEKLVEITAANEEVLLYERDDGGIKLGPSLSDERRLVFISEDAEPRRLFLAYSVSHGIKRFKPVYDWFDETLQVIPSKGMFLFFDRFFNKKEPLYLSMNHLLMLLDTGIYQMGMADFSLDGLPIDEATRQHLEESATGDMKPLLAHSDRDRMMAGREGDKFKTKKLVTYHVNSDGKGLQFELKHESEGAMRLIDLLPALLSLTKQDKVFVIDDISRGLHTLLMRKLIETYLGLCSKDKRSQLIFTTHDVMLMDRDLLRCDEMRVTGRERTGESGITALSEHKDIENDGDIRESYLQGKFGGIPDILREGTMENALLLEGALLERIFRP